MTETDCKDALGYLGNEDMTAKDLLRCLAASLEQMDKSESAEAAGLARSKARALIARLEPLVAEPADARSHLGEAVYFAASLIALLVVQVKQR